MKKIITFFILAAFLFAVSSPARAAVLQVAPPGTGVGTLGDVYPSIQAAIDDAGPGDTIVIHDGVYDETMNIDGKVDLTLQGESKENTIIKSSSTISWAIPGYPQYDGRMTVVRIYDSNVVTIENMTIDGDNIKGNNRFCISGWDSEVTVHNCILKNMSVDDLSGGYTELVSYFRAPGYTDGARAEVTFTDSTFIDPGRVGIVTHDYISVDISGNTFYKTTNDFGYAVEVGSQSTGQVVGNTIYGYDTPAASDGSESAGIYVENCFTGSCCGGSPHVDKSVLVQGNEIYDCQYAMWIGNGYNTYAGDVDITVTLTGNNFHDNVQGGLIIQDEDAEDGSSVTVNGSGNTVVDNNEVGYWIFTQGDGNVTVDLTGETISGNDAGIYVVDYASGTSTSSYNVAINGSSISGNGSYGVENAVPAIVVDAENNWWGDATGPYDGSDDTGTGGFYNPDGLGDQVSDGVDYEPWFANEGMQNPVIVYVDNTSSIRAYAETIKEGISAACDGDTIVISEGTYVEDGQIIIDKDLTIKGGSKPVIKPNQDTGTSGNSRGWWLVDDGVELHLQDLILDGSGYNIHQGIRHKGHGTVTNVDFKNIVYPPPVYAGLAVVPFGDGPVDISGCTFENIGRVGVLYFGAGVNGSVYSNNTYTGKGPGDWLDYGVELGGGAVAEIKDSNITDCNGIAEVDGSTSAGILVTTYYGDGTTGTITGNTFTNNTAGIGVGYDSNDTSVVIARCNTFDGNFEYGVDNIADAENSVDARYNWWGNSTGPGGVGGGSGDAVSANVEFFPWLLSIDGCEDYTLLAPDYVVDDNWAGLPDFTQVFVGGQDYYISLNAFDTIQGAVDAASDGNSISVAEGEYFGAVIDEDLTITGANPGGSVITDGPHYGGGHPTAKTAFKLDSGASGAEIKNFTIDCNSANNFYFAIFSRAADDVVVDSLTVNNPVQGITNYGGSRWQIANNLLSYTEAAGGGGIAIYLGSYPPDYVVLQDNVVKGNSIIAEAAAPDYTCPGIAMCLDLRYGRFDDLTGNEDISYNMIVDNDIVGTGLDSEVGIEIGVIGLESDPNKIAATLGLIHDNTVRNNIVENTDWGIYFYTVTDLRILGNEVVDCNDGIHIEDSHEGVVINFNSIYGNADYGVNNTGSVVVDASYNWWGDISGPNDPCGVSETEGVDCYDVETVKNADGLGNDVSDGNVIYCPWLLAPTVASDSPCPLGDLDGDCDVDFADLAELANNWLVGTE